ncbi:hypothetical protein LOD99_10984 [Oopsacas minuta]|uniref:Integrase catalytic domain-containing protein n=1 Tax=Oopsacas minuta TaxID=111878 RepID=A0AAV7KDJ1_9METZ|nr:hypothetical protein LOD99_10984 [Oopsacas minuta]
MTASLLPQPQRRLHPIVPPKQPWYPVGIDLVVDLPSNSSGYKHILVVVCYLSKFVTAGPLFTKTTKSVLDALSEIYLTYGVHKIIQPDQGKEFTNKANNNRGAIHKLTLKQQIKQKKLYDMKVQANRPDFKEDDLFLVLDKAKEKKIKGTKDKPKYKGPFNIVRVTESYLILHQMAKKENILFMLENIIYVIETMKIYLLLRHWLAQHRFVPKREEVQPQTLLRRNLGVPW